MRLALILVAVMSVMVGCAPKDELAVLPDYLRAQARLADGQNPDLTRPAERTPRADKASETLADHYTGSDANADRDPVLEQMLAEARANIVLPAQGGTSPSTTGSTSAATKSVSDVSAASPPDLFRRFMTTQSQRSSNQTGYVGTEPGYPASPKTTAPAPSRQEQFGRSIVTDPAQINARLELLAAARAVDGTGADIGDRDKRKGSPLPRAGGSSDDETLRIQGLDRHVVLPPAIEPELTQLARRAHDRNLPLIIAVGVPSSGSAYDRLSQARQVSRLVSQALTPAVKVREHINPALPFGTVEISIQPTASSPTIQ
ncbi:hypothetical protein [Pseudovibrio exalbescens]|nr:hypothetical protein [Pseudovibrio exalbescens]